MSAEVARRPPALAGRIGITLLCVYLLGVTLRIGGCYGPELAARDERPDAGPAVGATFPAFSLRDVSGVTVDRDRLAGSIGMVVVVPTLDWSPPTKAHLLDLADAIRTRRDVRVAIVVPAAQATPRSLAFVHDHRVPFFVLIDDAGLIDGLGLAAPAPDGTPAAIPATFVLGRDGRVLVRDVRGSARAWADAPALLEAAGAAAGAAAP
ncbi:MAG: redoxin domain-containing protein [Deltaproteobacteria bacterium]|nr:redoxin domain-containing protein [Deltaproteobacteria bacterium]